MLGEAVAVVIRPEAIERRVGQLGAIDHGCGDGQHVGAGKVIRFSDVLCIRVLSDVVLDALDGFSLIDIGCLEGSGTEGAVLVEGGCDDGVALDREGGLAVLDIDGLAVLLTLEHGDAVGEVPSSGVTFTVTSVPTSTASVMSSVPSKESLPCWVSESETVASSGSAAYAATGANALSMELAMSTADMTLAVMRLPSSLRFTRLILQKIRSMKDSFLDCLVVCLIAISNRSCSRRYRPRHPRRPPRCHLRPRPR